MLTKASRHPGAPETSPLSRRGFTLTELMIAVAVLLVVIIGTSKIFSTASQVTGIGQATASVMQEAAAIERQLRADLADLNYNGVFAIRCVKVRNDINAPGGGLLNPGLPADAYVRADQLLFFTQGVQSLQSYRLQAGTEHKGQGTASRVYYGHAFQLPQGRGFGEVANNRAHDPGENVLPWESRNVDMVTTVFQMGGGSSTQNFVSSPAGSLFITQPPATEWLLARQGVALLDDDIQAPNTDAKTVYLGNNLTARSLFLYDPRPPGFNSYELRNGRVEGAASQLEDVRAVILSAGDWDPDQRNVIRNELLYYPRAERIAPGMHRVDQALTNAVIGSACSSFTVEWTYENRVGEVLFEDGSVYLAGVEIDPDREQPWFGLRDPERGVYPYDAKVWWNAAQTIAEANLEQYDAPGTEPVEIYEAFFGYNQSYPLDVDGDPSADLGYTPWPSAIRITMTLHDSESKLPNGKVFQFVINLPRRVEDVTAY